MDSKDIKILELQAELLETRRQRDEAQREAIIWREASQTHFENAMAWMRRFVAQQETIAESLH